MSVVDLHNRITNNWEQYHENKLSDNSLIHISPNTYKIDDGPASVDLTIGDKWLIVNENQPYDIDDSGIELNPYQSILIETAEQISIPYNVFGMVTGKGLKIFQGTFISAGKIDPGFSNNLRIGIYNGSKKKINLQKGTTLCTCVFFEMETNITQPSKKIKDNSVLKTKPLSRTKKTFLFLKENKDQIAIVISMIALFASLSNIFLNRNFIFYKSAPSVNKIKLDK